MNRLLNIGVAQNIGTYSDGAEVPANAKLAFVSGTPGLVKPEILVEIEAYAAKSG